MQPARVKDCFDNPKLLIDKEIKDNTLPLFQINVANDSVVDKNLSLLPMKIIENENFVKLQDKNLRHENSNKNIYNCNQTDIMTSPTEKRIVNFFNWRVMLDKKGHLIIIGTLDCGNFARSKPIIKRLTATNVESIFNNIYHLNGNLVDYRDELAVYIRFKFCNGFPEDWENITNIWKSFVKQDSKFEYNIKKVQTQNAFNFKVHSCTFCGQKCSGQILKVKNDNNIYDKIYVPSLKLPSSSIIQKIYNINNNDSDKEILNKYENINDNQLPHLPKEKKMVNLNDDTQNTIITNLLYKGVPEQHISKIIEILGFDNNILSSKVSSNVANSNQVQNNEVVNNFERSYNVPLLNKSIDSTKNNVEEMHKTSRVILGEKQNVSTKSEKLESNAYMDKPKIISDRMLSLNEEVFCNSTVRSFGKFRESIKSNREIHHFDLNCNNIKSGIKPHDSVYLSESIDERNWDMNYTRRSNKRKRDNFSNNPNSITEESKWKKYENKTEMIEHRADISKVRNKFVDANQFDAIKRNSKNNTGDNDNQMVSLQQKQNITSAHLRIVKSSILENYLKSTPVLYNTKDINGNACKLISDEEIESDEEIYDNKYNLKKNHPISGDNDIQIECKKGFPSLTINSQSCIKYLATNAGNKGIKFVSEGIDISLEETKVEKLMYKPMKNLKTKKCRQ